MAYVPVEVVGVLSGGAFLGVKRGTDERKAYMLAYVDVPRFDLYDASKCQPFGYEARELLRQHILGKEVNVLILKDFENGSVLCVATYRGKNIAARLAESGFAKLREAKGKDLSTDEYADVLEACQRAEQAKLGLYSPNAKQATLPVVPVNSKVKSDLLKFGTECVRCAVENAIDPITFDVSLLPSNFAGKRNDLINTVYRFRIRLPGLRLVNWKPFVKGVAPNEDEEKIMKEITTMLVGKTVFFRLFGIYNTVTIGSVAMPVVYSSLFFTDKLVTDEGVTSTEITTPQAEKKVFDAINKLMGERNIDNEDTLYSAQNTDVRNKITALTRRDYAYWLLWSQLTSSRAADSFTIRALDLKGDSYADSTSLRYKSEADNKLFSKLDNIIFSSSSSSSVSGIVGGESSSATSAASRSNEELMSEFLSELPKFKALVTRIPGSYTQAGKNAAKGGVAMNSGVNAFYCIPLDERFKKSNLDIPKINKALLAGNNEEANRLIKAHITEISKNFNENTTEADAMTALGEIRVQFSRIYLNYEDANANVSAYETREFIRTILMGNRLNDNLVCPGIVTIRTDRVIGSALPTATEGGNPSTEPQTQTQKKMPSIAAYVYVTMPGPGGDKKNEVMVNEELIRAGYAKFDPMKRRIRTDTKKDTNGSADAVEDEKDAAAAAAAKEPAKMRVVNASELNPDTMPNYRYYMKLSEAAQKYKTTGANNKNGSGKKNGKIPTPEFVKTSDLVDLKRADVAKTILNKQIPCTIEGIRISKDSEGLAMNTSSVFVTVATHTPFIISGKKTDQSNVTIPNVVSTIRLGGISVMDILEGKTNKDKCVNTYMTQLLVSILNNMCNGCIYEKPFSTITKTEAPGDFILVKTTTKHHSFIGEVSFNSQYRQAAATQTDTGLVKSTIDIGKMIVGTGLGYVDARSSDLSPREIQLYVTQINKIQSEAESRKYGVWSILKNTYKIDNVAKLIAAIESEKFTIGSAVGGTAGGASGAGANSAKNAKMDSEYMGGVAVGTVEHPRVVKFTVNTKDKKYMVSPSIITGIIADGSETSKRPVKVHLIGISEESDTSVVQSCLSEIAKPNGDCVFDLLCFGTARLRSPQISTPQDCVCGVAYMVGEAPAVSATKVFNVDNGDWLHGTFNVYLVGELSYDYAPASFYGPRHPVLARIARGISAAAAEDAE